MIHGRRPAVGVLLLLMRVMMRVKLGRIKSGAIVQIVQGRAMYIWRIHGVLLLHERVLLLLRLLLLLLMVILLLKLLRGVVVGVISDELLLPSCERLAATQTGGDIMMKNRG